jgi:hypothetical protein
MAILKIDKVEVEQLRAEYETTSYGQGSIKLPVPSLVEIH